LSSIISMLNGKLVLLAGITKLKGPES